MKPPGGLTFRRADDQPDPLAVHYIATVSIEIDTTALVRTLRNYGYTLQVRRVRRDTKRRAREIVLDGLADLDPAATAGERSIAKAHDPARSGGYCDDHDCERCKARLLKAVRDVERDE